MNTNAMDRMSALALLALIVSFAGHTVRAQTASALYDYGTLSGGPVSPNAPLAQGDDGALYGTSMGGGGDKGGSVYKVTTAGKLKVLYNFCAGCSGPAPVVGLTPRLDGHFLGFAANTFFDISQTGNLTPFYSATTADEDGDFITLVLGPDGNFYGIFQGSLGTCGTAFRLTAIETGAVFTSLHKFDQKTEGCDPASLVLGADGNLYGTLVFDGPAGYGTVFKMTPNGKVSSLYAFDGAKAANPVNLISGGDGNFYGTAGLVNPGVIFKITPQGAFSSLKSLTDPEGAQYTLMQASDGNFYGTSLTGGGDVTGGCPLPGCGYLFEITPAGDFSILYTFDSFAGMNPTSAPIQSTNGLLYGFTPVGGPFQGDSFSPCGLLAGCGVLYSFNNNLPPFVALVPSQTKVGKPVEILGQEFTSSTTVSFNGTPATTVNAPSSTYLSVIVPSGATTGYVTVTTSSTVLTSNQPFVVAP
jgi:uncharacterized repeat protein (TIGR03803 family)